MRNSRTGLAAALVLVCAVASSGCGSAQAPTRYYSLLAEAGQRPSAAPTEKTLSVSVGPVIIPDILKQTRIATSKGDGSYNLSEYHRWSGDVDRDIARALAEHLGRGLGTEQVFVFPWDQAGAPAYRVLADVISMGGNPDGEATLHVRWTVVPRSGAAEPVTRRTDLSEKCPGPDHADWVAAQQRNVEHLAAAIAATILDLHGQGT